MTISVSAHGVDVIYANGCFTANYQGQTVHECRSQGTQTISKLIGALPAPVRPIFQRLTTADPDVGLVTVEENGSWFVSPIRTALQEVSAFLALFQPSDIQTIISNVPEMGAALQKYFQHLATNGGGFVSSLGPLGPHTS
jgi:hypothetical protein